MANRARRYERELRRREGVTSGAQRLLAGGDPVVQAGPFAGLAYPPDRLADIGAPIRKLLGVYEQEIAWVFERSIARSVSTFVDVGCADGYYAVGMAYASPATTTFAYDISSSARELCAETAIASAVTGRVRIGKRFSIDALPSLPARGALLLCDIEGGEVELLDERMAAALAMTIAVVEVHEDSHPGASDQLRQAFARTHDAVTVPQQPPSRPPAQLARWPAPEQSRALSEYRDPRLHWIVFEPKARES
jgi:hypothetical protein